MKIRFIQKIILVSLMLLLTVGTIFAWFSVTEFLELPASGSSVVNYFASGTGNESDPFILREKKHIYHLAWLQNLGRFQDRKYYFKLDNDIDMEGITIPPIGTVLNPFYGDFNGQYYTISRLFISNNKAELKTSFDISNIDLGNKVGFFGVINSPSTPYDPKTAGNAYQFYLENTNVSNSIQDSVIGIVAGHNNGNLSDIGVSNNSFKIANSITSKSDYVLIGELGESTQWLEHPSDLGNKILIDPNDPGDLFSTLIPIDGVQQFREIKASVFQHAYMTSTLNSSRIDGGLNGLFKVIKNSITESDGIETWTPQETLQISDLDAANAYGIPEEFWNRYSGAGNSPRYIVPSSTFPTSSNIMNVPFGDGEIAIPYNGIWFKPKGSGTCGISFLITNQSDTASMGVYEFKRDENGNIDNITWKQTQLKLPVSGVKNKQAYYYDFEVKNEYEYVIGVSSVSPNATAGFFYLILEGVGYEGDGMSTTKDIDYVMRDSYNVFPKVSETTLNNTSLSYSGSSSTSGYMYFNKYTFVSETKVFYYSGVTPLVIKEKITNTPESKLANLADLSIIFGNWMDEYLNNP